MPLEFLAIGARRQYAEISGMALAVAKHHVSKKTKIKLFVTAKKDLPAKINSQTVRVLNPVNVIIEKRRK